MATSATNFAKKKKKKGAGNFIVITWVIPATSVKSNDLVEFHVKSSEKRDLLSLIWAIVIYLISLFSFTLQGFVKLYHSIICW